MTSWIGSLLTTSQPAQSVPTSDHEPNLVEIHEHGLNQELSQREGHKNENTDTMEKEEEARPPYLHVGWQSTSPSKANVWA